MRRQILDSGSSDTVYVWEPKSITISEGATLAMSIAPPSQVSSNLAEPGQAAAEPLRGDATSTSGNFRRLKSPRLVETICGDQRGWSLSRSAPSCPSECLRFLRRARGASAKPSSEPRRSRYPQGLQKRKRSRFPLAKVQTKPVREEDSYLLVSKSWYIEKLAEEHEGSVPNLKTPEAFQVECLSRVHHRCHCRRHPQLGDSKLRDRRRCHRAD